MKTFTFILRTSEGDITKEIEAKDFNEAYGIAYGMMKEYKITTWCSLIEN